VAATLAAYVTWHMFYDERRNRIIEVERERERERERKAKSDKNEIHFSTH
jgi:hypothetical protein